MKKFFTALMIGLMVLTVTAGSTVEASRGIEVAAKMSAPKVNLKKAPAPSKPAAPSTPSNKSTGTVNQNAPSSGGFFGSFGGIGGFAKGMLTGALLGAAISSIFGSGAGFIGQILGMFFNALMFFAMYKFIGWAWRKFRSSANIG